MSLGGLVVAIVDDAGNEVAAADVTVVDEADGDEKEYGLSTNMPPS